MLRHLHIRNLAVVEESSIELDGGLNVLSGSTGAGKSIVVDSMALLSGGRGRSELIRSGEDLLTVTGVFEPVDSAASMLLEEAGIDPEGSELVIRREISREGRNRIFVNDRPVTLRLLTELAPFLLRIHTQREELGLVSPELQRFWLDRSGGEEAKALLDTTRRLHAAWETLDRRWQRLAGDERLRLERIDLLRFQLGEIDAAGLERGEEATLRTERDLLRHREAIQQAIGASFDRLSESDPCAVDALARSEREISGIEEWEPAAGEWVAELESARIRVEEVAKALAARLESLPDDAGELDAIETRLATIDRLLRKYGDSSDEVLDQRDRIAAELAELEASEEDRESLAAERDRALAAYLEAARQLSEARVRWGRDLAAGIERELADLALGRARLAVDVGPVPREGSPLVVDARSVEFGPEGIDRVVILLQANPGQERGPLAKVASGGELSRVYLALQLVVLELANPADKSRPLLGADGVAPPRKIPDLPSSERLVSPQNDLGLSRQDSRARALAGEAVATRPTLIFDEVDAGIGGSEAAALGRKLRRLSEGGQILAVTHLPQVASCGHTHYRVTKSLDRKRTRVDVERLASDERRREIARMLSGDEITETALSNASELLEAAAIVP